MSGWAAYGMMDIGTHLGCVQLEPTSMSAFILELRSEGVRRALVWRPTVWWPTVSAPTISVRGVRGLDARLTGCLPGTY